MSEKDETSPWGEWLGLSSGPASMVYREWETWFGEQVERLAGSEHFAGHVATAFERSAGLRAIVDKTVRATLMRDACVEVDALERRVSALEEKIRALESERS